MSTKLCYKKNCHKLLRNHKMGPNIFINTEIVSGRWFSLPNLSSLCQMPGVVRLSSRPGLKHRIGLSNAELCYRKGLLWPMQVFLQSALTCSSSAIQRKDNLPSYFQAHGSFFFQITQRSQRTLTIKAEFRWLSPPTTVNAEGNDAQY